MQRSPEALKYRPWYKLKIWVGPRHPHPPGGLRWNCLVAALFTCKACGWQAKANETDLLHADHIVPHRGVWELFCDPKNLQCLCETCSNAAKQSEERLGYSKAIGDDGWPIDPRHPGAA